MLRFTPAFVLGVALALTTSPARSADSPASAPLLTANQTRSPSPVVIRQLRRLPDVVIGERTGDLTVTPIHRDVDWVVPSPKADAAILGRNLYTVRVKRGQGGIAFRHPRGGPLPVARAENRGHVAYSPDGRHLVVTSELKPLGKRRVAAVPKLTVLSVPQMRVVQRVVGTAPIWTGPKELAFRRGSQPFRLRVGGRPQSVGVTLPPFGCLSETWSAGICKDPSFTNLLVADRGLTRWFAIDTHRRSKVMRFRLVPFDGTPPRTLLRFENVGQAMRPTARWSEGKPYCGWQRQFAAGKSRLICVSLDDGRVEQLHEVADDNIANLAWLDDERLVYADDAPVIVDIAAGTITRVRGLPAGWASASITPMPGGRRLVAHFSTRARPLVIDLAARTYAVAPVPRGTAHAVRVASGTDERFVILGSHRASWVDVTPNPRRRTTSP